MGPSTLQWREEPYYFSAYSHGGIIGQYRKNRASAAVGQNLTLFAGSSFTGNLLPADWVVRFQD